MSDVHSDRRMQHLMEVDQLRPPRSEPDSRFQGFLALSRHTDRLEFRVHGSWIRSGTLSAAGSGRFVIKELRLPAKMHPCKGQLKRRRPGFQRPRLESVTPFPPSLVDGVTHLDRPVEPFEPLSDLFRSWGRLARGGTGTDEAPEADDNGANVRRVTGGHPDGFPVAL